MHEHDDHLGDAATFVLWFNAWRDGRVSLDDARDAIVADDAGHDVSGLAPDALPLILALGRLASMGVRHATLALPVAGDPIGLAGPAPFNLAALEVEEAVLLAGVDLGLIPRRAGRGVVWESMAASSRRQVPLLDEARSRLRQTLISTADELTALDVARWSPDIADALMALRRPSDLDLPPALPQRVVDVLEQATRCRAIVGLAAVSADGSVTAHELERRRRTLEALDHAARHAVVAAVSATVEG